MGILRRAARDFDEKGEEKEGTAGPFELLMREKLPRLLSINFSNYVAEDVPPEENRLSLLAFPFRPTASCVLPILTLPPFLLSSSLSLISFAR